MAEPTTPKPTTTKDTAPASHPSLIAALVAAKKDFGPVLKESLNPAFKSKYADLANVLDAVNDPLCNNGLALYHLTEIAEGGAMQLRAVLEHVSGDKRESVYALNPAQGNNPQSMGSAITYARRYSTQAMLGIAPEDDDGNAASTTGTTGIQHPSTPTYQRPVDPGVQQPTSPARPPQPSAGAVWGASEGRWFEASECEVCNVPVPADRVMWNFRDTGRIVCDQHKRAVPAPKPTENVMTDPDEGLPLRTAADEYMPTDEMPF